MTRRLVAALSLSLAVTACKTDRIQHLEADGARIEDSDGAPPPDAEPNVDAAAPPDAVPGAPALQCDPTVTGEARCQCMAAIVCDQIHFCLEGDALNAFPNFAPYATCVAELVEDCVEDLGDPDYEPADYPACLVALEASACADFGPFACVGSDFPAECSGLRALDTALGVLEACD